MKNVLIDRKRAVASSKTERESEREGETTREEALTESERASAMQLRH